jgi:hypothetical protein
MIIYIIYTELSINISPTNINPTILQHKYMICLWFNK